MIDKEEGRGVFSLPTIPLIFIIGAVFTRVFFWIYTDRVWEDALISLTPARNVWEGHGLTHHASEPRVHSFTSAFGELILIAGEYFRQGLNFMRLSSILAASISIALAYAIGQRLGFSIWAHALVLSYLAADHLQIFFGMSGMETQVAVAVLIANVYFFLAARYFYLGLVAGIAVITRPEFVFMLGPIGIGVILWDRRGVVPAIAGALLTATPWLAFATWYYGSPIPNTIYAKQALGQSGLAGIAQILDHLSSTWKNIAPFRQYWAAYQAPLPDGLLIAIVTILLMLFFLGAFEVAKRDKRMIAPVLGIILFFVYRSFFTISNYFMWYMPPYMAMVFLIAAAGIQAISATGLSHKILSAAVIIAYTIHLPFTLPLDRAVQQDIENQVRLPMAIRLNELMGPDDTAFMEPLGYTGWYARNKTIYDFPGLGSPIALAALKGPARGQGMPGVARELRPTFMVLRPNEWADIQKWLPDLAARYETVEHFRLKSPVSLKHWGLAYWVIDADYRILRLRN